MSWMMEWVGTSMVWWRWWWIRGGGSRITTRTEGLIGEDTPQEIVLDTIVEDIRGIHGGKIPMSDFVAALLSVIDSTRMRR